MNKNFLMGRLTADPQMNYSGSGDKQLAIAKYTLAIDRDGQKDKNGEKITDFIRCTAFGKLAELAEKYLHKGDRVLVTARVQTGDYTDKDGKKVYTTDFIVEEQKFIETKKNGGGTQQAPAQPQSQSSAQPQQTSAPAQPQQAPSSEFDDDDDEFY